MHRARDPRITLESWVLGLSLVLVLLTLGSAQRAEDRESPWRYRYDRTEVVLDLDLDRAIVRLAPTLGTDLLVPLLAIADPALFLPPTRDDLRGYPSVADLRFRPEIRESDRVEAIRALAATPGVEFASAAFSAAGATLIPRSEIFVVLDPQAAHQTLASLSLLGDLTPLRSFPALEPTWLLRYSGSPLDTFDRARDLEVLPGIRHAQPNFIRHLKEHGVPNDTLFPSQWNLDNTGQYGGSGGSDIGAVEAWDIATGSIDVTIAIVDEGVDVAHPDLVTNMLPGHNAVAAAPPGGIPGNAAAGDAHGTACAGIAAATGNNGLGIAGVCWTAQILPVRIGFGSFWTQDDWILDGITWAADHGADVISCSWGGGPPSVIEQNAIGYAVILGRGGLGTPVFCSSGNGDIGTVAYPAAYPETIAVGASSPCDERKSSSSCDGQWWWGSQWGPQLDLVAPGPNVTTTDNSGIAGYTAGNYVNFGGTSSACPHAAGAAALLLSIDPLLTVAQVRQFLTASARDQVGLPSEDTPGWDPYMGWGRLDILQLLIQSGAGIAPPNGLVCTPVGEDTELSWTNGDAYDSIQVTRDGLTIATLGGTVSAFVDVAPGNGLLHYAVRGVLGGTPSPRTHCSALVVGTATDLVWSPASGAFDGGLAIAEALFAAGRLPIIVDTLADAGTLGAYQTIWVNLGIFPSNHTLTGAEGSTLSDYLLGVPGDRHLYLEGGDTWFFDPPTAVHAHFGIIPISDGNSTGDLAIVQGIQAVGCDLSALSFDYIGENQWIDRIAPAVGSGTVLTNSSPPFDVAIFRDSGSFQTLGASFELAGLEDGLDSRDDLIEAILTCWSVPFFPNPLPDPVTLLSCTGVPGAIQLAWVLGDVYDSVTVLRNGVLIANLPGTASGFIDPTPGAGLNAYEVFGVATGLSSPPAICVVALDLPQNELRVANISAVVGDAVTIDVIADHELPLEGYTFALTFDPAVLSVVALSLTGTELESLGADFFAPDIDNSTGTATVTAMVDAAPPITEAVPAGNNHVILRVLAMVLPGAPIGTSPIGLPESLGSPAIVAGFIENGGAVYPPDRIPGTIDVSADPNLFLRVATAQGTAGVMVTHPVLLDTDRALIGYSFGISFDPASLDLYSADLIGTVASGAAFFLANVDPAAGWVTVSALLDLGFPSALQIDPGLSREILSLSWAIDAAIPVGTDLSLPIVDGLGNPPVSVVLTDIFGTSYVPVTEVGSIEVIAGGAPLFQRGDANLDFAVNLSDPVGILGFLFNGASIACADAADTNDDALLDLADAVYLLSYLFAGGNPPPLPFPDSGPDPTPDALGCP